MGNNNSKAYFRVKNKLKKNNKTREQLLTYLKYESKFQTKDVEDFITTVKDIKEKSEKIKPKTKIKFNRDNEVFEELETINRSNLYDDIKVKTIFPTKNTMEGFTSLFNRNSLFDVVFRAKTLGYFRGGYFYKPIILSKKSKFKIINYITYFYNYIGQYFEFLKTTKKTDFNNLSNKPYRMHLSNEIYDDVAIYQMAAANKLYRYHRIVSSLMSRLNNKLFGKTIKYYNKKRNSINDWISSVKEKIELYKTMYLLIRYGFPIESKKIRRYSNNIIDVKKMINYHTIREKYEKVD